MKTLTYNAYKLKLSFYQDGDNGDYWFCDISEINGKWDFNGRYAVDKFRLAYCSIEDGCYTVSHPGSKSKLIKWILELASKNELYIIEEDEYGDPIREL